MWAQAESCRRHTILHYRLPLPSAVVTTPPSTHTQVPSEDQTVVALIRAGVDVATIHAALGITLPLDSFREVARALDAAAAVELPAEDLPSDLEDAAADLVDARAALMKAIRSGTDSDDGGVDAQTHMALCKNADTLLKFQAARQDRQAHRLNVRVAQEKARAEILALYGGADAAPGKRPV